MSVEDSGSPVYLKNEDVKKYLCWKSLVPAVKSVLKSISLKNQSVIQPARLIMPIPSKEAALLCMPAYIEEDDVLTCKVVTSFRKNSSKGLPSIIATVLLFDGNTGAIKMIMEGTEITTWRTAAASVAATQHLCKKVHDKGLVIAILGSGVQGHIHAQAFMNMFDVKQIRVWNHRPEGAKALCQRLGEIAVPFVSNEECVRPADIIVTATYAPSPVVHFKWLKPGAHINAIGFGVSHHSELDDEIYQKASITVDSMDSAVKELRDLIEAGVLLTEVGDVINGNKTLSSESGVTVFQSMGIGGEDAITAKLVYNAYMKEKHKQ